MTSLTSKDGQHLAQLVNSWGRVVDVEAKRAWDLAVQRVAFLGSGNRVIGTVSKVHKNSRLVTVSLRV